MGLGVREGQERAPGLREEQAKVWDPTTWPGQTFSLNPNLSQSPTPLVQARCPHLQTESETYTPAASLWPLLCILPSEILLHLGNGLLFSELAYYLAH